ncbi:ComEC/Rec2 family competence protein [Methanobrevibacter millerae]|uniref:Metallo-beta-lactamase superfamily protein n=1 Tax=Methanobrevibacter millerae TaxID=230361 RepID=A0A1G5V9Z7_9EURY|nr:MBL fold metallo-hydrolase [Methanobrevibacter millerae]SDA42458.1 Metallo-beta-lactamase superfamily protein [Methanobrevibacter millerae]
METLNIKIFDLNRGNSVFIKTSNDRTILFDIGGDIPVDYLYENNIDLDCLIISHPHKDHIKGLLKLDEYNMCPRIFVGNKYFPDELYENLLSNASDDDKKIYEKYMAMVNFYNAPISKELKFENPNNWGGLEFLTYCPKEKNNSEVNYYSLALLIKFYDAKILLMGDNDLNNISEIKDDEDYMELKHVDILLAPHHGLDSYFDLEFVSHLNPLLTIISDKSDESSAREKYYNKTRGLIVGGEQRRCLTTRNDGDIFVDYYHDDEGTFIHVHLDEEISEDKVGIKINEL